MSLPILYTFRRCPYAMRARLGLAYAGVDCEIREVFLSDKPASLLKASPKGTVPVLILSDGKVLEESLHILEWALKNHDPDGWNQLTPDQAKLVEDLIQINDTDFKRALDRYKYPTRYATEYQGLAEDFSLENRYKVEAWLQRLETLLETSEKKGDAYLVKPSLSKADIAIFPFIRQFAQVDQEWFDALSHKRLKRWLQRGLNDPLFELVMHEYPIWREGDFVAAVWNKK